jgi:p-aminobenzoyl-glutamate transporter AbgT
MGTSLTTVMAVLFVVLLVARIIYSRQIKRMRHGKEVLNRFERDHNQRPLGL